MRRQGFTLIEILVVIAILVILAGLLTPVLASAKRSAQEISTKTRLHQFQIALSLYQQDWGAGTSYGRPEDMGLPLADNLFETRLGLPIEFWQSPCGNHPSQPPILMNYDYYPGEGGHYWMDNVGVFRENIVLMFDMNCSDPTDNLDNYNLKHKGVGVLLGGQLVVRRKSGNYWNAAWWSDPPM